VSSAARLSAPAKINLRLNVLGKRPDGYHDIDTLFQAIDLADEVTVRLDGEGVRLDVVGAELGPTEDNLAYRAALRFAADVGHSGGVAIELTKRVPAGAGLGGGSSDAAAVLRCLAALRGVDGTDARLGHAAAALGSDVPFFLCESPLARGRGRGEVLEPVVPLPEADLVLVSPPVHVATAEAYAALSTSRRGSAPAVHEVGTAPRSWAEVAAHASNDFQAVVAGAHAEIRRSIDAVRSAGAAFTLMSGSGSSVFGAFADRARARDVAGGLEAELGWPCRAVRTLEKMPVPRVV
jgi:4-diphosphocytidyl-2-C-methyl-D-erythritol kinase